MTAPPPTPTAAVLDATGEFAGTVSRTGQPVTFPDDGRWRMVVHQPIAPYDLWLRFGAVSEPQAWAGGWLDMPQGPMLVDWCYPGEHCEAPPGDGPLYKFEPEGRNRVLMIFQKEGDL